MRCKIFLLIFISFCICRVQADLISHLKFDGDCLDSGPGGNNGLWHGGARLFVEGHDGKTNGALQFDGVDDYVEIEANIKVPIYNNDQFTISFWVKGDFRQGGDKRVFTEASSLRMDPFLGFGTDPDTANDDLYIYLRDNNYTVKLNHAQSQMGVFDGNDWHHIAWVDDNGMVSLFIDGGLSQIMNNDQLYAEYDYRIDHDKPNLSINKTAIGAVLRGQPSHLFKGAVDDFRFYDEALSQGEILEIAGFTHGLKSFADLVFAYAPGDGVSASCVECGGCPGCPISCECEACLDWTGPATGAPDFIGFNCMTYASLGVRGEMILKFSDNLLVDQNARLGGIDLLVYEVGDPERFEVFISKTGEDNTWFSLGSGIGSPARFDLSVDCLECLPGDHFRYVKIVDMEGASGGVGGAGADIDSVGAIGSINPPDFIRGDVNADSKHNLADAIVVLTYLFDDGATPSCLDAADVNDSGKVDLADAIALLDYLFLVDVKRLPMPFPSCGGDPTLDELDCDEYKICAEQILGFTCIGLNEQGYAEYAHNQTGIVFVSIPGGTFTMGSPTNECGRFADGESPAHEVTLSPFLIGKYEVSQAEWLQFMGNNPSRFKGDDLPVEQVTRIDCDEFCMVTGLSLPTEAQWEYACRAGTRTPFNFGFKISTSEANIRPWPNDPCAYCREGIERGRTVPVNAFSGNNFGLHNMHGNVHEWCNDWYDPDYYDVSPVLDPRGPAEGMNGTVRGGSWYDHPRYGRSAHRGWGAAGETRQDYGFRVAYNPGR